MISWQWLMGSAVISMLMATAIKMFPALEKWKWYKRFQPAVAPVVGVGLWMIPGMPVPENISTLAARVMFGLWTGLTCTWGYKQAKTLMEKHG
jgi:hypothetical protein